MSPEKAFGPAPEILVLISYGQKPSLNPNAGISSKTKRSKFWYEPVSTEYLSNEGSGETVQMCRLS